MTALIHKSIGIIRQVVNADCYGIVPDDVKEAIVQLRSITATHATDTPIDLAADGFFLSETVQGKIDYELESQSGLSIMRGETLSGADTLRLGMLVAFEGNRPPDRLISLISVGKPLSMIFHKTIWDTFEAMRAYGEMTKTVAAVEKDSASIFEVTDAYGKALEGSKSRLCGID
jgi:hypothetical protein